jgi:hypothetical protein
VASQCNDASDPPCEDVLDGLNGSARAEVMTCVNSGCTFGLYSCMEGIAFVP